MLSTSATLRQLYCNGSLSLGSHCTINRQVVSAVTHFTCIGTVNLHLSNFDQSTRYFMFVVVLLSLGYQFKIGHCRLLQFTVHNDAQPHRMSSYRKRFLF
jgi:hypothetical protein